MLASSPLTPDQIPVPRLGSSSLRSHEMSQARWNEWLGPNLAVFNRAASQKKSVGRRQPMAPHEALSQGWPGLASGQFEANARAPSSPGAAVLSYSNKVLPLPCHVRLLLAPRRLIPARSSCGAHWSGAQWSVRRPRRQIWAQPRPNRHTHLQPVRRPLQHPPADAAAISRY
ncbi:hypothetical protein ACCO45_013129 [Purpureocillium lilacinum]|uniref:Uncharacterized protein n=1 Tax=Purpureocillium lilacinum TaxID=33203 RepID=A0ACC4DCI9_PURLI